MKLLIGWGKYMAAFLILSVGVGIGYKTRDIFADAATSRGEAAYSRLETTYTEYRLAVAEEVNTTNARVRAELGVHRLYIDTLEDNSDKERVLRNQVSQNLTEGLRNAQETNEGNDVLGAAMLYYLSLVRNNQRTSD